MSIIPLIRNINHRTVAVSEEEFSQAGGIDGTAVLIRSLDETQLAPGNPNVSYDLRVGPEYRDHRNVGKKDLNRGDEIVLLPGAAVIIQTEEDVHFPRSMFGYIVPKVTLLQRGISNTVSKVDPGYNGPLLVSLFNLGKETVPIKRGEPFCSISIHQVLSGAVLYNGPAKRIVGEAGRRTWQRLTDKLEANHVVVLIVLILAEIAHIIADVAPKFRR
jgi:deoxycytidine triphosphate deaminase